MSGRRSRVLGATMFTDIVGSTSIAAEMGNARWVELVARHHRVIGDLIARFGGTKIDTAGDGFFATFDRPADAIRCAWTAAEAVQELGIEIRAAVGFGELESIGRKPGGLIVNTTARIVALADAGQVLVPIAVRDILAGAGISFEDYGTHRLRGIEGEARLFRVVGIDGASPPAPLDPEAAAKRRSEIFPRRTRQLPLLVGVGAGAVVVLAVVLALLAREEQEDPQTDSPARGTSVVSIDPTTNRQTKTIPLGVTERARYAQTPKHPLAAGEGGVWVLRPPALIHVDPLRPKTRSDEILVGSSAFDVRTGQDFVWVISPRDGLQRIHAATNEVEPVLRHVAPTTVEISEAIWMGLGDGTLIRFDPRTEHRRTVGLESSIDWVAVTDETVWVADVIAGELIRIDPVTLRPIGPPITVGGTIDRIVADGTFVWVLDRGLGTVTRIDATAAGEPKSARIGDDATDMAAGFGAVWVSDGGGSVYRIDATTLADEQIRLGAEVLAVAADDTSELVWAYVGEPIQS